MFRIKYSREILLKLLYLVDVMHFTGNTTDLAAGIYAEKIIDENIGFFPGVNNEERAFISKILNRIISDKANIDTLISENLKGWKLERLNPVDRALLRMGVAESYFNDQKAVIIDDVIRISKKYGSEESYKIINAILDKVIK